MTDRVIFMLEMSVGDLALIYQLARNEKVSVNEWVMKCILEKIEKMQEEWRMYQKIKVIDNPNPSKSSDKEKGGDKV